MSNYMGRRANTDSVFNAKYVIKHIFGRKRQINIIANNTGSNYGLMRAIPYDSFLPFLAIADQNYTVSRTIGLSFRRKRLLIFQNANILFTMGLTFIRRGVLSV